MKDTEGKINDYAKQVKSSGPIVPITEGYLYKKGDQKMVRLNTMKVGSQWKKRFFKIEDGVLNYYREGKVIFI